MPMKISLIQMDIAWGDIAANCAVASQLIDAQQGCDLYILPEMFSTGFATNPEGVADAGKQTLTWMHAKADAIDAAICGSVATRCDDGSYRNRFYFVKPHEQEVTYYDKHHLFTYGNEHQHYTRGDNRTIVEWRGVKFLLQVCYDLRFPVFSRNAIQGTEASPLYDCALYVASWPTSRIRVWNALLMARAIENQCYVIGVNRVGDDPVCSYSGGTQCIDAYGRLIATCPDGEQTTALCTLDLETLGRFRKKFPVLSDGDVD